jgi:hypothetical protein
MKTAQFWPSELTRIVLRGWLETGLILRLTDEAEVALGLFNVGWPGERISFEHLCEEYEKSHVSCLSESSQEAFENHHKHLVRFFGVGG